MFLSCSIRAAAIDDGPTRRVMDGLETGEESAKCGFYEAATGKDEDDYVQKKGRSKQSIGLTCCGPWAAKSPVIRTLGLLDRATNRPGQ